VIETISKKAMTRYNTISHHRGRHPEPMAAFDCEDSLEDNEPGERHEHEVYNNTTVLSLHLPGASLQADMDQLVDGENVTSLDPDRGTNMRQTSK
jgi:hypothetical protein